jgi:hypothetical protein
MDGIVVESRNNVGVLWYWNIGLKQPVLRIRDDPFTFPKLLD